MRYFLYYSLVLLCVLSPVVAFKAEAVVNVTLSLSRMDAIIKEMQALRTEFAALSQATAVGQSSGAVLGASASSVFTQSLEVGATNNDIERIQKLLATDKEIYGHGVISGFFGPKTEEAIKNLQTRYGLSPVGAIGPATKALLEQFFIAYPDGIYPEGVLLKKPTVLGVATSKPTVPAVTVQPTTNTGALKTISTITAQYDNGDAEVKIKYADGTKETLDISSDSKLGVIDAVALKTVGSVIVTVVVPGQLLLSLTE